MNGYSESCGVIRQHTSSIEFHKHWEKEGRTTESEIRTHATSPTQYISHFEMPQ